MKRNALYTVMITMLACLALSGAAKAQGYTTKGIMEIGGSVAGSITVQDESQQYSLDLSPSLNYFIIDRVHLGIKPIYRYNLNYTNATKSYDSDYEILPMLTAGYTFPLSEKLYLNIAPQVGFRYANIFNSSTDRNYMYLYYGLLCALKYDFGGSLLHVNLEQYYRDRISNEGPESIYKLLLGVG